MTSELVFTCSEIEVEHSPHADTLISDRLRGRNLVRNTEHPQAYLTPCKGRTINGTSMKLPLFDCGSNKWMTTRNLEFYCLFMFANERRT